MDLTQAGMAETPARMARAYAELFIPRAFRAPHFSNEDRYDQTMLAKRIPFSSVCDHLLPCTASPGAGGNPVAAVSQLRAEPNQPDAVFAIASTTQDATRLVKAFGQARYSPPGIIAFGDGFLPSSVLGAAGSDGEDLLASTAWSREIAGRNASAKPVMDLYEERFHQPMSDTAAGTFTAVLVLAEAINNAHSTDSQRARAALLNLDIPGREMIMPWSGVRFDASHQNVAANGVVEQRVQGLFRVVFPDELQQAKPVWPRQGANA